MEPTATCGLANAPRNPCGFESPFLLYAESEETHDMAAKSKAVVNLDALIQRADLAAPGEASEDIADISVLDLDPKGFLYPALRKPDFQRETASWTPEQVADLIGTFVRRDLIPAVILWRAGQHVFVIDGAHRLSALIAWVHDDYGDKEISRTFFQDDIPDDQIRAAARTRELVEKQVGSFSEHKLALEKPDSVRPEIRELAPRLGWQKIPAQWIRNPDHGKAEKSFFRINQGGTPIDRTEARILNARHSAIALASRAILRGGTGHDYWDRFSASTQDKIEELGKEIHKWLFDPPFSLPIKTLDLPIAGQGYGPRVLPFVFDLIGVVNNISNAKTEDFVEDADGRETIRFLENTRKMVWRLCSTHASSLGLHPALYFYSRGGVFQPAALLSFAVLFREWDTDEYKTFTSVRADIEQFLLANRGITEAIRRLGSGARSRPRMISFYNKLISDFGRGKTSAQVRRSLRRNPELSFLVAEAAPESSTEDAKFTRDMKGAAFLHDALPQAPKCPTCHGLLHHNGMHAGHKKARRDGGHGTVGNAHALGRIPCCADH